MTDKSSETNLLKLPSLISPVESQLRSLQADLARSSIKRGLVNHGVMSVDAVLGSPKDQDLVLHGTVSDLAKGTQEGRTDLESLYRRRVAWRQWTFAAMMAVSGAVATLLILAAFGVLWADLDLQDWIAVGGGLGAAVSSLTWLHHREAQELSRVEADLRELLVLEAKIRFVWLVEDPDSRDQILTQLFD